MGKSTELPILTRNRVVDCAGLKHLLCCLYRWEVHADDGSIAAIDLYVVIKSSNPVTFTIWRDEYQTILIVQIVKYSLQSASVSFGDDVVAISSAK